MPTHFAPNETTSNESIPSNAVKDIAMSCVIAVIAAFLLEILVFNLPHWRTLNLRPVEQFDVVPGTGLSLVPNRTQTNSSTAQYIVEDATSATLRLTGFVTTLDNIHLDATADGNATLVDISFNDAASSMFRDFPDTRVFSRVPQSTFVHLEPDGESSEVQLHFLHEVGTVIEITALELNAPIPFVFSPIRIVAALAICLFIALFRPMSSLHTLEFSLTSSWQTAVCIVLLLGMMLFPGRRLLSANDINNLEEGSGTHIWLPNQYDLQAEALLSGHVNIDLEVPDFLAQMENPYDFDERNALAVQNNSTVYFDIAYYDGKYYSYFGIVPTLLITIPFQALTGHYLGTTRLVSFWLCLSLIAILLFTREAIRVYKLRISFGAYLLLWISLVLMCGLPYHYIVPQTYSVPYVSAFFFIFTGLALWLKSRSAHELSAPLLCAGSLFMALSVGCRPTFVFASFLSIPIFWDEIVHTRQLFSLRGTTNTVAALLPFFAVAVALGWYNFIRFDGFTNFGAAYHLTSFDMTKRSFKLTRIPPAFFDYFLQAPVTIPQFPFIRATSVADLNSWNSYIGWTSHEPLFGGYLSFNPVLILMLVILISKCRNNPSRVKNPIEPLAVCSIACALISFVVVVEYSGITQRYMSDFGWALGIATFIIMADALQLKTSGDESCSSQLFEGRWLVALFVCCIAVSFCLNIFMTFASGGFFDPASSPSIYYSIRSMFEFL